jgi:hypothetical protein
MHELPILAGVLVRDQRIVEAKAARRMDVEERHLRGELVRPRPVVVAVKAGDIGPPVMFRSSTNRRFLPKPRFSWGRTSRILSGYRCWKSRTMARVASVEQSSPMMTS